jgi:hypothetical protein
MLVAIFIIIACALFKSTIKEGYTNNDNIVLIGDSVLNNAKYVPPGKTVLDALKPKLQNIHSFAEDGATITDGYMQLNKISFDFNKPTTHLFISAGGNNMLNHIDHSDPNAVSELFNKYLQFIKSVKTKLPDVKLNLLNLYLPPHPQYKSYKESIDQWNKLLQNHSKEADLQYNVIDIHSLLTGANDFVDEIEPSEFASQKIASAIYLNR